MKKTLTKAIPKEEGDMRSEYDFSKGVRGKHYRAMQAGYTVTTRRADGTAVVKRVNPERGAVTLAPDVQEYFPDSESVNTALRSLIKLIPAKHAKAPKKTKNGEAKRRMISSVAPRSR